jgi:hypothetical protein
MASIRRAARAVKATAAEIANSEVRRGNGVTHHEAAEYFTTEAAE